MPANSRTATIKGQPTKYPVPYYVWSKTKRGGIPGGVTWEQAQTCLAHEQREARPLRGLGKGDVLSPWLSISPEEYELVKNVIAPPLYEPTYKGRAGVFTGGLNGVFFVRVLERFDNGALLIQNLHDVGKIKVKNVRTTVEADLVYPLVRGRSVSRWGYQTMDHILMVQDPETMKGYKVEWMQRTHPLTWGYLKRFETKLRGRPAFKKFFKPATDAFYSMYDVSKHTFSPYKVAWMDISSSVKATAVVTEANAPMPILEHGVMFLTTETPDEAYYVAAVLNTDAVGTVVSGYIVDNHLSTHPIENVIIPKFDPNNPNHAELAGLSWASHTAKSASDEEAVERFERDINRVARRIW